MESANQTKTDAWRAVGRLSQDDWDTWYEVVGEMVLAGVTPEQVRELATSGRAARDMLRDTKLKADQIEHEMALLETQTKAVEVP